MTSEFDWRSRFWYWFLWFSVSMAKKVTFQRSLTWSKTTKKRPATRAQSAWTVSVDGSRGSGFNRGNNSERLGNVWADWVDKLNAVLEHWRFVYLFLVCRTTRTCKTYGWIRNTSALESCLMYLQKLAKFCLLCKCCIRISYLQSF